MGFPYDAAFLALLAVYLVYSVWQHLDPRFPILAALILLVVTALVDAAGAGAEANTLAVFVFFLLAGGVLLLLIDSVRPRPSADVRTRESPGSGPEPPIDGPRPN
ncbi:MAG: hypothetical protein WCA77_01270 [Thermoplasmata archaeon]